MGHLFKAGLWAERRRNIPCTMGGEECAAIQAIGHVNACVVGEYDDVSWGCGGFELINIAFQCDNRCADEEVGCHPIEGGPACIKWGTRLVCNGLHV